MPAPGIDLRLYRALAPFLRARWRDKFRIDTPVEVPPDLSWRQRRTLLALCPAVAATGTTALEALAFATPLVTDEETATELGGTPGIDMLVCTDRAAAAQIAAELGRDHRRTRQRSSHAGRRLAERAARPREYRPRPWLPHSDGLRAVIWSAPIWPIFRRRPSPDRSRGRQHASGS